MEISEKLQGILATLPAKPGCYIMKNAGGTDHLCRQGDQPEEPRPFIFSRGCQPRRENAAACA